MTFIANVPQQEAGLGAIAVRCVGSVKYGRTWILHEVDPIYNEKIKMLRNGQWQMMTEPMNYDRERQLSFAA